jgi:hypothetical protein
MRPFEFSLAAILALALTAGCEQIPGGPPAPVTPDLQWQTELLPDAVRVALYDRRAAWRIDSVTLVGPAGQAVPAREMTRVSGNTSGPGFGTSLGIGGAYGSRSGFGTGVGLSFPLGGPGPGYAAERRTEAVIPLPDPASYHRDPSRWHIEVSMSAPFAAQPYHATIPAPTGTVVP